MEYLMIASMMFDDVVGHSVMLLSMAVFVFLSILCYVVSNYYIVL